MKARIYKPSKHTMQSGKALTHDWLLEYETISPRRPDPLMGWVSSDDTLNQIRLKFKTKEEAIRFAESKGWKCDIQAEQIRKTHPKNYIDNFKPVKREAF
jgi:hypothetical protein